MCYSFRDAKKFWNNNSLHSLSPHAPLKSFRSYTQIKIPLKLLHFAKNEVTGKRVQHF